MALTTSIWKLMLVALLFLTPCVVSAAGNHEHPSPETRPELRDPDPTQDQQVLDLRKQQIRRLYEDLVFPKSLAIVINPDLATNLFEKSVVKGRVTPVGQFTAFTSVVEYFYALAVNPQARVDRVNLKSLMAEGDQVAVSVDIHFCYAPFLACDQEAVSDKGYTLTQVGFFRFNRMQRIISFDLNILNLGAAVDIPNTPAAQEAAISQLCTLLTQNYFDIKTNALTDRGSCTETFDGPEDFPKNFAAGSDPFDNCQRFLASIPFGSWNRANSNSVVCRQLHAVLTTLDPSEHCPHTSAEGGGKCIDFPYGSYYQSSF